MSVQSINLFALSYLPAMIQIKMENNFSDRTYSASRLVDEVPGPVSPGCSPFAPSARHLDWCQIPSSLYALAPRNNSFACSKADLVLPPNMRASSSTRFAPTTSVSDVRVRPSVTALLT